MAKRISVLDREKARKDERGVRAYTNSLGQPTETQKTSQKTSQKRKGILVKLPEDLIRWRDDIWRARLAVDPKAEKSVIIEEAIREYQKKLETEGDHYLKR